MIAIIPSIFNVFRHIDNYKPSKYNISNFDVDHAMFILGQLYETVSSNKMREEKAILNDGFVEIYSKNLQKYVRNYHSYIKYFIETEVIESDNYYIAPNSKNDETKCYGYRYTKFYRKSIPKVFQYSTRFEQTLQKNLKKQYASTYIEYGHLTKYFHPECKLKIDKDEALRFIEAKRNILLKNPELKKSKKFNNNEECYKDPNDQFNYSYSMIQLLYNQSFSCKIDNTVHRLYTPLTNMYSPLRNFIKHEDEHLYSIDICNSQPYISLILFNNNTYNKNNIIHKCNNKVYKELAKNSPMLCTQSELTDNEDFIKFQNLVGNTGFESHDLYSYMLEISANYRIGFTDRTEAKNAMFEALFSTNHYLTKPKKMFSQIFPTVYQMFKTIKSGDHTRLAVLLQSIESHLILKVITKHLANKYPNMPLYTIHDSIATTEPYVEILRYHMTDMLTKKVGVPPKLKVEMWCSSNLNEVTSTFATK